MRAGGPSSSGSSRRRARSRCCESAMSGPRPIRWCSTSRPCRPRCCGWWSRGRRRRCAPRIGDSTAIVSAVPIPSPPADAIYFEAAPLDDIEETLDTLAFILFGVAAVTTMFAAAFGWWAAGRLLNPLFKSAHRGRGPGRGRARHSPHSARGRRPGFAHRFVQQDGPGPRREDRPRRPLRVRGQPRVAVPADDADRLGGGSLQHCRRVGRAGPHRAGSPQRRHLPLPAAGGGSAGDQPLRRGHRRPGGRGGAHRRVRAARHLPVRARLDRGRRLRGGSRHGGHGAAGRQASPGPGGVEPGGQCLQVRQRRGAGAPRPG